MFLLVAGVVCGFGLGRGVRWVWVAGVHADGAIQKTWETDWLGTFVGGVWSADAGRTDRCIRLAIRALAHASAPWKRTRRGLRDSSENMLCLA